jgi:hypothetical protein
MSATAFTATEKAYIRTFPHAVIGMGLAVHVPATVWQGTISSAPVFPSDGTGVGQLSLTTTSGDPLNVKAGQTVIINGVYYTVVRKVPSGTTLYIDSLGAGTVQTSVGTIVKVINEFLPQPLRHRYNAATWYAKFDLAYTNQNTNFGPQAVMGCSSVIYADGNQTFSFNGSLSRVWTPGSTISTYLWTFPDATTSALASPTWSTSTAYPDGAYVSLKVTDSNGDTHTGYRLLFKFDSSNVPKTDFEIVSLEYQWGAGCTLQIRTTDVLFEQPNTGSNFKSARNHVVLFGTTAYGATVVNIGGNATYGQNVWLDGWVMSTEAEYGYDGLRYVYTIQTVDAILDGYEAMPIALDDAAAATTWLEMVDPTLDMIALHLCKWRSTILDCVDVFFCENAAAARAKKYGDTSSQKTLWEQLQQIYSWLAGGTVSSDWQSGIWCEQNAIIAGNVASLPQICTLFGDAVDSTRTMVRDGYEIADRPLYILPISKYTLYGVNYDVPVGSRAPDDPIAHGQSQQEIAAGLAGTQTELNTWAGNLRAQADHTAQGRRYPLVGIIRIDPTPQSTVSLNDSLYNMIVRAVEWEFDAENGMAYCAIGCEKSVTGAQAGQPITFT